MNRSGPEQYENLQKTIQSRRLERCNMLRSKIVIKAAAYASAEQLRAGDEIVRRVTGGLAWHHGIYMGAGNVSFVWRSSDGVGVRDVFVTTHAVDVTFSGLEP